MARTHRDRAFASLHHVLDLDWMLEAYRTTRKDGAAGIDGVTAADYAEALEANLLDLLSRIKSGRYRAPPVRRSYIPKADGSQRPLGIPTFEDKVAQRAIVMLLEAIYEQDFLPCSYGFRPGRSAHDAVHNLRTSLMTQGMRWVLDIDIRRYFDTIPHDQLRSFLDRRVTDGVVRRMIDKWLKAGVLESGSLTYATEGTPQGGVISPLLANIYLHYVLDEWVAMVVEPRLKGRHTLVRYADDFVMAFEDHLDAKRVFHVLGQRLNRYGLTLHPEKSRFIDFRFRRPGGLRHPATSGTTFDFLGFTHVWGRSLKGKNVVRQVTAKGRFARALSAVTEWCQRNRHQTILHQHAHLSAMLRGHYGYYGITGNGRRVRWYLHQVERIWKKWLSRRGRHGNFRWDRLRELLSRHPLPPARIMRQYTVPSEALP
ncbi:group II intron reverse transcriptase/maturase [Paeniroseomonas aquatica]|uniref:group II intron reverse transcriptase/maturase n=3 Tax=Paeniroseomonas aquatica TaxID=373043 RepID=UPI003610024C